MLLDKRNYSSGKTDDTNTDDVQQSHNEFEQQETKRQQLKKILAQYGAFGMFVHITLSLGFLGLTYLLVYRWICFSNYSRTRFIWPQFVRQHGSTDIFFVGPERCQIKRVILYYTTFIKIVSGMHFFFAIQHVLCTFLYCIPVFVLNQASQQLL